MTRGDVEGETRMVEVTTDAPATRTNVGIVGCGNIAPRYVRGTGRFRELRLVGCADVDQARAGSLAEQFSIRAWNSVDELLEDPAIAVVVNLTPPVVHKDVTLKALEAGKHVYVEKPLATDLADAAEVMAALRPAGPRLGCAPDTFLGSAAQTARAAIDRGLIGEPIGVAGFVTHSRAEMWHPDPTFLFQQGGGPLLALGPYWITAMINCLGPVSDVGGMPRIGATPRHVLTPNRLVEVIDVEVTTHATAVLRFASGVVGTVIMSFDIWHKDLPYIEIDGTEGALRLSDPNGFDGPVRLRRNLDDEWQELAPVLPISATPGTPDQMLRGMGVADLVASIHGSPQRATPSLAFHVLEVLEAVETSSRERRLVRLKSTCERPAPVRPGDLPMAPLDAEEPTNLDGKEANNV